MAITAICNNEICYANIKRLIITGKPDGYYCEFVCNLWKSESDKNNGITQYEVQYYNFKLDLESDKNYIHQSYDFLKSCGNFNNVEDV